MTHNRPDQPLNSKKRVSFNQFTTIREFSKDMPPSIVQKIETSTREIKYPKSPAFRTSQPSDKAYYRNSGQSTVPANSIYYSSQYYQHLIQQQRQQAALYGSNNQEYSFSMLYNNNYANVTVASMSPAFNPFLNPFSYYNYWNAYNHYMQQHKIAIQSSQKQQPKSLVEAPPEVQKAPTNSFAEHSLLGDSDSNVESSGNDSETEEEHKGEIQGNVDQNVCSKIEEQPIPLSSGKEKLDASESEDSSEKSSLQFGHADEDKKLSPIVSPLAPSSLLNQGTPLIMTASSYISISSSSSSSSNESFSYDDSAQYVDASVPRPFYNSSAFTGHVVDTSSYQGLYEYSFDKDEQQPSRKKKKSSY